MNADQCMSVSLSLGIADKGGWEEGRRGGGGGGGAKRLGFQKPMSRFLMQQDVLQPGITLRHLYFLLLSLQVSLNPKPCPTQVSLVVILTVVHNPRD